MGILIAIGLILSVVLVILAIPVTYRLSVVGEKPVTIDGNLAWGSWLGRYAWHYVYGEKPVVTISWPGTTKTHVLVSDDEKLTDADVERAAKAVEDEDGVTYDEVNDEGAAPHQTEPETQPSWKPLVFDSSFLAVFFTYVQRLLWHSRVRTLTVTGSLGLGQPHQTGMLAGACYAVIPGSVQNLSFNYLAEDYDCTVTLAGHIYPIVFVYDTLRFLVTKPARQVLAYWRRRGEHHG